MPSFLGSESLLCRRRGGGRGGTSGSDLRRGREGSKIVLLSDERGAEEDGSLWAVKLMNALLLNRIWKALKMVAYLKRVHSLEVVLAGAYQEKSVWSMHRSEGTWDGENVIEGHAV